MSQQKTPWRLNVRLGPLQFLQGIPAWLLLVVLLVFLFCCCCVPICVGFISPSR